MRFDNIFVPKGNGLGWTLNFDNPVSMLILVAFLLLIFILIRKKLKSSVLLLKAYFKPNPKDTE